ncbi:DUF4258 domain-containing protein [Pararhizobium antarcticum]|uniref:DUF4258 domain-containing protein n=1 Tax=Pararhizobium antarcticum TaxID=1798805 RepID=A0A657LTC1_9HYPH|nr:hypothetical protein AX760_02590 [Pararhizobium antarcticum]
MIKPLRYTLHAETVIRERGLNKSWIENTVRQPDWRIPDPEDKDIARLYRHISERGDRILRVACLENVEEIRIISAFFDRKARRP